MATVCELISLQKVVRDRVNSLKDLRKQISTQETYFTDPKKEITPLYSVQDLDKQIVFMENFLFESDSKIKHSNAITEIKDYNPDVKALLAALK